MKSINVLFFLTLAWVLILCAKAPEKKNILLKSSGIPSSTLLNINQMSAWYSNNGEMERNPVTGNSGLSFPRGTSYAVYTSGLMIGAIATDGIQTGPRITGFSYNKGFQPGAILGLRTGIIENPEDANVRIWRIRRDYATADLTLDASEFLLKSLALTSGPDVQKLRDQYKKDWIEWPVSKGAPFYDSNNDGIYSPQFEMIDGKEVPKLFPQADEPGVANGDQVIWYVCNDIGTIESPWKTKPMGLEQQVTIWGYRSNGVTGNILFKKFKLIYKGTAQTPVGSQLKEMYLTHWSDPDLGDAGDDFVGCDTLLNVGYIYNSKLLDGEYAKFKLAPPSLGYDFLQGPIVPSPGDTAVFDLKKRIGYKNLPITSFVYHAAGGTYGDPPFTYNGSVQWYQMMRGLPPTPQGPPDPNPIEDPMTQRSSKFWLSGDPITRMGWIDGIIDRPGDRRMLQSSGPFTMALGDTQEIVVGVVCGMGNDYLQSISQMKENDRYVQFMYNSLFEMIPPSVTASVSYPNATDAVVMIKAIGPAGKFNSVKAGIISSSIQLFDDGGHGDSTANDGIFANTVTVPRSAVPTGIDISFTDSQNKQHTIPKIVERITTSGPVTVSNASVIFDNINNNGTVNNGEFVHYTFTIKNNTPFALPGVKAIVSSSTEFGREYSFGAIGAGGELHIPNDKFFTFRLPMNFSESHYKITVALSDTKGNFWNADYSFPVIQQTNIADSLVTTATDVVGTNDAQVGFVIFDKNQSGGKYDLWFGGSSMTRNWTVVRNVDGIDYASVNANLLPADTAAIIRNSSGSMSFTINDAKTTVAYKNFSIESLSGSISSVQIHAGPPGVKGGIAYTFSVMNNSIADGSWQIPDSLVDDFIAGNLYVNVTSALRPNGELRGQIADGLIRRQTLHSPPIAPLPIFSYPENRMIGFSLYVAPATLGPKSINQIAPTFGPVLNTPNPEKTYSLFGQEWDFAGPKVNESTYEIRFIPGDSNYAIALPRGVASPTPSMAKYSVVPFGIFQDTTRVWPVFVTHGDSIWNIDTLNGTINNKPVFDVIIGVVDVRDYSNYDLRYYQTLIKDSLGRNVPNPATVIRGRLMNSNNRTLKNIYFVNETADGIPPKNGTIIKMVSNKSVKVGDVKSFTLKTLGVSIEQLSSVPHDFSVSQNYPNPFNPSTKIEFTLPRQSHVSLKVYDVIGREVATLLSEEKSAGRFIVEWNGKNQLNTQVSSGVYFYKLESGNFVQTKKMLMLK